MDDSEMLHAELAEAIDLDKLIHELDMQPSINQGRLIAAIGDECFVCGLIDWVQANAHKYAFGPELCIAERLSPVHRVIGSPVHQADRLKRRILNLLATQRERRFRHEQEMAFLTAEAERWEAIAARQAAELAAFRRRASHTGLDS